MLPEVVDLVSAALASTKSTPYDCTIAILEYSALEDAEAAIKSTSVSTTDAETDAMPPDVDISWLIVYTTSLTTPMHTGVLVVTVEKLLMLHVSSE